MSILTSIVAKTMRGTLVAGLAVATVSPTLAQSVSPVGQWELVNGESRYRVSYCGGKKLCAKLVWLHPKLRTPENQAMLNSYIVRGAEPADERVWAGEVNFDGKTYQGTVTLLSDRSMRVSACSGMLCQSFDLRNR